MTYGQKIKVKDPTSFRRHVASPSRPFLQVPGSFVVCPCRITLGLAAEPFGSTVTCFSYHDSHSSPMGTAGLYPLHRSGWWISPLFRLVGALFSANLYLDFCCKNFIEYLTFSARSIQDIFEKEYSYEHRQKIFKENVALYFIKIKI